jgi:hypothetical protein
MIVDSDSDTNSKSNIELNSDSNSDSISETTESENGFINLYNEFTTFKEKIFEIEKKLDRILELVENDCKKMRDHIDFVEHVYDNVKTPFNYVMNSVNSLMFLNRNLSLENVENNKAILDDNK